MHIQPYKFTHIYIQVHLQYAGLYFYVYEMVYAREKSGLERESGRRGLIIM